MATTREGGLHFILSDNSNYDFDIEVKCCGLVSFLKVVIDCGCLESWCGKAISVLMDMCMQFIIVAFYDKFITNEVT